MNGSVVPPVRDPVVSLLFVRIGNPCPVGGVRDCRSASLIEVGSDILITLQSLLDLCIRNVTECLSAYSRHGYGIRTRELALDCSTNRLIRNPIYLGA